MTFAICNLQFENPWASDAQIKNRKSKIENGLNLRLGEEDICDLQIVNGLDRKSKIGNLCYSRSSQNARNAARNSPGLTAGIDR